MLDHLEDNIRRVIADIRPQMLEKVIENWTSRLDYIRASRGSHAEGDDPGLRNGATRTVAESGPTTRGSQERRIGHSQHYRED
ncbi:hypothetical protein TNCV_2411591 [Trichonephila clavipes]|nr:hypothetical protein TNCV_2411591 [Trichonephila clavipes]